MDSRLRIYLACTVKGDRSAVGAARTIARVLEDLGHEVLTGHLLRDDVDREEARLTAAEVFRRDLSWLDGCDVLVAEASGSSFGVGFEVGYVIGRAADSGKRVVLVYDAARQDAVSRLITGNAHPSCATYAYRDHEDLADFLRRALADGRGSGNAGARAEPPPATERRPV